METAASKKKLEANLMGDVNREEFNQLIYLFLDGEATEEEIEYIEQKCNTCEHSAKFYHDECDFYRMIKKNLERSCAPSELIGQIRAYVRTESCPSSP